MLNIPIYLVNRLTGVLLVRTESTSIANESNYHENAPGRAKVHAIKSGVSNIGLNLRNSKTLDQVSIMNSFF